MDGLDIPALMARADITGLSLAVTRRGKVEVLEAYGYAGAGVRTAVKTTTVFEGASLGKPVFAYAVLQRADAGRIDLAEPLIGLSPALVEAGEFAGAIT